MYKLSPIAIALDSAVRQHEEKGLIAGFALVHSSVVVEDMYVVTIYNNDDVWIYKIKLED